MVKFWKNLQCMSTLRRQDISHELREEFFFLFINLKGLEGHLNLLGGPLLLFSPRSDRAQQYKEKNKGTSCRLQFLVSTLKIYGHEN